MPQKERFSSHRQALVKFSVSETDSPYEPESHRNESRLKSQLDKTIRTDSPGTRNSQIPGRGADFLPFEAYYYLPFSPLTVRSIPC